MQPSNRGGPDRPPGRDLLPGQREGAAPGRGGRRASSGPHRAGLPKPSRGPYPPPPPRPHVAAPADTSLCRLNRNLLRRLPPGPGRRAGSAGRGPARRPPWPRRGKAYAAAAVAHSGRSSAADRPAAAGGPGRLGGRGSRPPPPPPHPPPMARPGRR